MSEEATRRISINYRKGRVSPSDIAGRSFAVVRKGFDSEEVRSFLEMVSRELEDANQRETELQEALADAEHRANNPTIDEATLTTALGNETAKVLRTAHEVAAEIISKAEADAQLLREEAAGKSDQMREQADKYAKETRAQADLEKTALLDRANEEALARVENARLEGEAMIAQSKSECMAMVKEAQGMREKVLTDLSKKRSILMDQVTKLREARDRTAQAVWRARHEIEKMSAEMLPDNEDGYEQVADKEHPEASSRDVVLEDTEFEKDSDSGGGDRIGGYRGLPGAGHENRNEVENVSDVSGHIGRQATASLDNGDEEEMISELGQVVEGSRTQLVDEIFARLRAGGQVSEVSLAGEAGSTVEEPENSNSMDSVRVIAESGSEQEATATLPVGSEPEPEGLEISEYKVGSEPESGSVPEHEPEPESDNLLAYDDTINDLSAGLAKKIKKILQDYQNDLLEQIRGKKQWDDSMLPAGRYADDLEVAALTFVRHAARQGAISVYEKNIVGSSAGSVDSEHARGAHGVASGNISLDNRIISDEKLAVAADETEEEPIDELLATSTELDDLAVSTAKMVIEGLSDRILEGNMDMASADVDSLVDHVGAAYREWKGARIDSIAEDQIRGAYSVGQLLVGDKLGIAFKWVSRNSSEGCPDCDDNALSDPIGSGEKFPTGHLHPPAHAKCHCLLVQVGA